MNMFVQVLMRPFAVRVSGLSPQGVDPAIQLQVFFETTVFVLNCAFSIVGLSGEM